MDKQADTPWRLTLEDRRRRRGWRLCRLPGLWRRADPAREWRTRKPPTGATRTWTASLSGAECRRWQDARAPPRLKARENASTALSVFVPCTLWAGTHKVRSFAKGQGRGWPWSKTPSCHRLRPGGANGKRCPEELPELLNITSRCITRSRHKDDSEDCPTHLSKADSGFHRSREELYNVALCYDANSGTDGDSKRPQPGRYCTSLGGWEGLNLHG